MDRFELHIKLIAQSDEEAVGSVMEALVTTGVTMCCYSLSYE